MPSRPRRRRGAGATPREASVGAPTSSAEQVEETARKHFAGHTALWLLALDPDSLGETLRWEPSRGGALFPHLYGPLGLAEVHSEQSIIRDPVADWVIAV